MSELTGAVGRRTFLNGLLAAGGAVLLGACASDTGTGASATTVAGSAGAGGPGGGEAQALAEAFKGVTTDGNVIGDLYAVGATGATTDTVLAAAQGYLASLSADQKARTVFEIDADEWRKWSNVHAYEREGVGIKEMTAAQRTAAFALLQAGLSAKGFTLSRDIMKLNRTAGQLVGQLDQFDETLYYLTVMGTPSADEPWGWQFEGHHLVVNYFVLGDQVVMTPTFMGSEPVTATVGEYKGLRVFDEEIAVGLAVMEALDQGQRSKAVVEATKSGNNAQTEAFKDNAVVPYAGVRAADLSSGQRERLMGLAGLFVGNMDDAHAAVKLAEVREHLDDTWFSWVGGTGASDAFYYRLQSPVVLIEFDCQGPGPIGQGTGGSDQPSRDHIHSVVRTPNGNDYGKDLLRQHLAAHPH